MKVSHFLSSTMMIVMKIYVDDDGIGSDDEDDNGSGEERLLWPPL